MSFPSPLPHQAREAMLFLLLRQGKCSTGRMSAHKCELVSLRFLIRAVWGLSWCESGQDSHQALIPSRCCRPALPCQVLFQDPHPQQQSWSFPDVPGETALSGVRCHGRDGYSRHFLLRNSSGPAPCLCHRWQTACNLWGTLGPACIQTVTEERQRKMGKGGRHRRKPTFDQTIKPVRRPPLEEGLLQKGGRGLLAPHFLLSSSFRAPEARPSRPMPARLQPHPSLAQDSELSVCGPSCGSQALRPGRLPEPVFYSHNPCPWISNGLG